MNSTDSSVNVQNSEEAVVSSKGNNAQKPREHDERLRLARARVKEIEKRKLEELRESIERSDECRRKQEEERRKRTEEMKQRDGQRRAHVEERKKKLVDEENERKQALLKKMAERTCKLEQIKLRKGSGTCIAMQSPSSSMHNVIQSLPTYEPEVWNDRNIENVAIRRPKMKKRLSTSVDQISRICSSAFDNDPYTDVGLTRHSQLLLRPFRIAKRAQSEGALSNVRRSVHQRPHDWSEKLPGYALDTVSSKLRSSSYNITDGASCCPCSRFRPSLPIDKSQAKSMESVRRSRADLRRKVEPSFLTKSGSADVILMSERRKTGRPETAGRTATARRAAAEAVPSSEELGRPVTPKASGSSRTLVSTTRLQKSPGSSCSSPVRSTMPSPPKSLTPTRLQPKSVRGASDRTPATASGKTKKAMKVVREIVPKQFASEKESEADKSVLGDGKSANVPKKSETPKGGHAEEKYKQKLAENRRLAREKAEQKAEEDRQREGEERRQAAEQQRLEEEKQRKLEEEQLLLVEENKRLEEERFRQAVEETERQKREEEDRLEAERSERLAAEKQAQEETEKREKEHVEKIRREEEDRLERKRKLEMIMRRVKVAENGQKEVRESKSSEGVSSFVEPSQSTFQSPLLRQFMGNKQKGKSTDDSLPAAPTSDIFASKEELNEEADSKEQLEDANVCGPSAEKPDHLGTTMETGEDDAIDPASSVLNSETSEMSTAPESSGESCSTVDQSDSNLEVVVLSPCNDRVIKTSDDNQNWTISVDDRKENPVPDHLLPDLPRIAFEDGPTNTLPDILR